MTDNLNGESRVHFIVGDPIAQVKSPGSVTQSLQARGLNAWVMPAHVAPPDLADWVKAVSRMHNLDGIIVTVPHKFDCFALCASSTRRAAFLQAVNVMRRDAQGRWHGDMCDGPAYAQALQRKACTLTGRRALLVGAGGAGSAIAYALVEGGVRELAVHDADRTRRDALIVRLSALGAAHISIGSPDPTGFDIAINASPAGMQAQDASPIDTTRMTPVMVVGCVITSPAVTPLIAAARAIGCTTVTGGDMFAEVSGLIVDFLTGSGHEDS